jgi:glycosyltransferase involved in cell wall biosynthesis
VHNGEKYLAQAIESVLCQTHRELELVVIDDGSTDGSLAIMERYARADRRVRVVTQENRGVTATGNRGLEEARGDWVARLDADDLFFPEKIERQLAFVKRHPDLRIAGTRGLFINDQGRSEPSFEMFRAAERRRPLGEKVCAFLLEAGERLYQRAALHYAGSAYPSLAACLLASLALNPSHVIPRLYDRKIVPMLAGEPPAGGAPVPAVLEGKEACGYAPGK